MAADDDGRKKTTRTWEEMYFDRNRNRKEENYKLFPDLVQIHYYSGRTMQHERSHVQVRWIGLLLFFAIIVSLVLSNHENQHEPKEDEHQLHQRDFFLQFWKNNGPSADHLSILVPFSPSMSKQKDVDRVHDHQFQEDLEADKTTKECLISGHFVHEKYELMYKLGTLGVCDQYQEHDEQESDDPEMTSSLEVWVNPLLDEEPWTSSVISSSSGIETRQHDGPTLEYQCVLMNEGYDINQVYINQHYELRKKFNAGSHGEIWRASKIETGETFILKRIFVEKGRAFLQSGLREIYFGKMFRQQKSSEVEFQHMSRYVEHFYKNDDELWLVFHDEGLSLRQYLYEKQRGADSVIFQRSRFWTRLRREDGGMNVVRETMRQLLEAVQVLHARGVIHRDIKPSNILILRKENRHSERNSREDQDSHVVVKLADFGSSIDAYTLLNLYDGSRGPSQSEETREYQPPEVLFHEYHTTQSSSTHASIVTTKYDLWSIGVVFLEIILGSPQVFELDSRARAKVDAKIQHKSPQAKSKSYLLHSLAEYCIYQPSNVLSSFQQYALVPQACHIGRFNETLRRKDPLGIGFQSQMGLDLLWRLLAWSPVNRISAVEALEHAYFRGPYRCPESDREFATRGDLETHQAYLKARDAKRGRDHQASLVGTTRILPRSYVCPQCGRTFQDWNSCHTHAQARKHFGHHHGNHGNRSLSSFCQYDVQSMISSQEKTTTTITLKEEEENLSTFGYYQMAGRRPYMEDAHVVHDEPDFAVFVILDGHSGSGAVSFLQQHVVSRVKTYVTQHSDLFDPLNTKETELYFHQLFRDVHEHFVASVARPDRDFSGSTITLALILKPQRASDDDDDQPLWILMANVGDSTAIVLNKDQTTHKQVSMDHYPDEMEEQRRIESSGGFIETISGIPRVMGQLAISRSIGDYQLAQYVSHEPTVARFRMDDMWLLVLATDGLWETLTQDDVRRFIVEHWEEKQDNTSQGWQDIATALALESYVRGSSDNIAVLIIDLEQFQYV